MSWPPSTTPVSSTTVSQWSARGRCGVPTCDACSPTSRDWQTPRPVHRYSTFPAGVASPFVACAPTRPCDTSRPTYLCTCSSRRAQRRVEGDVQDAVEFVEADVTALQFADNSFDLCVTYNGLHCLPDPHAALAELTRVLSPGGTLRGTSCVTGRGLRKDALIAMLRRAGVFGNAPRAGETETWLRELGLDVVTVEHSGAIEFFEAKAQFEEDNP